jgi:HK97 family phage prohead protease
MTETATLNRAWSTVEIRSFDEEARVIEGVASTPSTDLHGDVVEPLGAKFALPLPLLWQHDHDAPVGHVEQAKTSAGGIAFKARFAKVEAEGALRDRLETAWQSVRSKLVRGVSIGFVPLESEPMANGGRKFKSWRWIELSCVTVPSNQDASISVIRSLDEPLLAAAAQRVIRLATPAPAKPRSRAAELTDEIRALQARKTQILAQIRAHPAGSDAWGRLVAADDGLQAQIELLRAKEINLQSALPEDYGLAVAPDAARALSARLDAMERTFAAKLAEVERRAVARSQKALSIVAAGMAEPIKEAIATAIAETLGGAEPVLRHAGTWSPSRAYAPGSCVTHAGSLWVARALTQEGETPGAGATAWRLAVKTGGPR